jgi:type IV secretory pathway protease TraF
MTDCPTAMIAINAAVVVLRSAMHSKKAPLFVWNASESVPIGLYRMQAPNNLIVTSLVVAMPPEALASFLAESGYLPRGVPLIKRHPRTPRLVRVPRRAPYRCRWNRHGRGARERDNRGGALPVWQGCRVIGDAEVFLMNWDEPASLDAELQHAAGRLFRFQRYADA